MTCSEFGGYGSESKKLLITLLILMVIIVVDNWVYVVGSLLCKVLLIRFVRVGVYFR